MLLILMRYESRKSNRLKIPPALRVLYILLRSELIKVKILINGYHSALLSFTSFASSNGLYQPDQIDANEIFNAQLLK